MRADHTYQPTDADGSPCWVCGNGNDHPLHR
jgi:hypothetical protein